MLLGHTLLVQSLFVAPVTGLLIIFIFSLWEKSEWIKEDISFNRKAFD